MTLVMWYRPTGVAPGEDIDDIIQAAYEALAVTKTSMLV